MPTVNISLEAEADIDAITHYTKNNWGWRQANIYLARLEETFELLARSPSLGRSCGTLAPGLRRFESGRHVVFYREQIDGVLIVRILHQRQLPLRSRFQP